MMNSRFSVADSGGTSTHWGFYDENGSVRRIVTPGMHPKYLLDWTPSQLDDLNRHLPADRSAPLHFYGAGCGNEHSAAHVAHLLNQLGFRDAYVYPDTLGACRACCGREPGTVAILGTGSVLLQYDGDRITKRVGGYGSLIGDEGSGFYFGKLLVKGFLEETLGAVAQPAVKALLGSPQDVLFQLSSPTAQQWISGLAALSASAEIPLENVHRENLRAFAESHLSQVLSKRVLHVTGSYGWFQQEHLHHVLKEYGWHSGKLVQEPLDDLMAFHAAR